MEYPKISIVTPSYNQSSFLEQTILSVIGQSYPNLEYIIIDGGSTDNSVEIIKKYEKYITYWVSEKDNGQAHAINKGFEKATGDILGWLNSDDMHLPDTLTFVAKNLTLNKLQVLVGNSIHIIEGSHAIDGSNIKKKLANDTFYFEDPIIQPSSFWNRKTWQAIGPLKAEMHYIFDWEWFLQAFEKAVEFLPFDKYLSIYRIHENHKTGSKSSKRVEEVGRFYREHKGADFEMCYLFISKNKEKMDGLRKLLIKVRLLKFEKMIWSVFCSKLNKIDNKAYYGMINMTNP